LQSGRQLQVAEHPDIEYQREMGLTRDDFFRLIPSAMGEHVFHIEGDKVHAELYAGTLEISIGRQQERRIALMVIPFAEVSFLYRNVSQEQHDSFKAYFDLRFQRGGG